MEGGAAGADSWPASLPVCRTPRAPQWHCQWTSIPSGVLSMHSIDRVPSMTRDWWRGQSMMNM